MSEWIAILAEECERSSQATVARRLGYSPAVINQVLKRTYKGDVNRVQAVVEGALMGRTVDCPVVGELPRNTCLDHQRAPFAATNAQRVRLYRACRSGCPHSRIEED